MATLKEIQDSADKVKASVDGAMKRLTALIASIANPAQADVTASDAVVKELTDITSSLDSFHNP